MADGAFRQLIRRMIPRNLRWLVRAAFKRITGLYYRDIMRYQRDEREHQQDIMGELQNMAGQLAVLRDQVERTPRAAVHLREHRILTRTVYGHKMLLDSRDKTIGWHLALDGYWEPGITAVFMDTVKDGMTVVDVGAHVGYFTLLACSLVGPQGKVIAFEPDPQSFDNLATAVLINGFVDSCECVNKAVTDCAGRQTFCRKESEPGGNTLWPEPGLETRLPGELQTIEVDTISLDDFLENHGRSRNVDVIKVDAEGSEGLVIDGMKRTLIENQRITLICEFCPERIMFSGGDPKATVGTLVELGFQLRHSTPDGTIEPISTTDLLASKEVMLFLRRS